MVIVGVTFSKGYCRFIGEADMGMMDDWFAEAEAEAKAKGKALGFAEGFLSCILRLTAKGSITIDAARITIEGSVADGNVGRAQADEALGKIGRGR